MTFRCISVVLGFSLERTFADAIDGRSNIARTVREFFHRNARDLRWAFYVPGTGVKELSILRGGA